MDKWEKELERIYQTVLLRNKTKQQGIIPYVLVQMVEHQLGFSHKKAKKAVEALVNSGRLYQPRTDSFELYAKVTTQKQIQTTK